MLWAIGGDGYSTITANAGTRIQQLVGGVGGLFTHLVNLRYTDSGTAHTLTIMRGHPGPRAKNTAPLTAGGTSLVVDTALTKSDNTTVPAANDLIAAKLDNGTWLISTISAYNATTLTYTLNTSVPTGRTILKGAVVILFGVAADAWHSGHTFTSNSNSSAFQEPALAGQDMSLTRGTEPGDPLVLDSNNATNAGTFNNINVTYAKR